MATVERTAVDLADYCRAVAERARAAATLLAGVSGATKIAWLGRSAQLLRESVDSLHAANAQDLKAGPGYGLSDAQIDRLRLTDDRIEGIAAALEEVATLPDPVGRVSGSTVHPNGLVINKKALR